MIKTDVQRPSVPIRLSALEVILRPTLRVVHHCDRAITIADVPDVVLIVSNTRSDEEAFVRVREVAALLVD